VTEPFEQLTLLIIQSRINSGIFHTARVPGHTDNLLADERVDEAGLAHVGMAQGTDCQHSLLHRLTCKHKKLIQALSVPEPVDQEEILLQTTLAPDVWSGSGAFLTPGSGIRDG
jgi:hypothetical protein